MCAQHPQPPPMNVWRNDEDLCRVVACFTRVHPRFPRKVMLEGNSCWIAQSLCLSTTVRTVEHGDKDNVAST